MNEYVQNVWLIWFFAFCWLVFGFVVGFVGTGTNHKNEKMPVPPLFLFTSNDVDVVLLSESSYLLLCQVPVCSWSIEGFVDIITTNTSHPLIDDACK